MQIALKQLEKFISDSGLISKTDLNSAVKEASSSGRSLGDILVSEGKLKDSDLKRMEAYVLGIPFVSLIGQKISPDVLSLIPEPIARNHNIIAYNKSDKGLEVAMLDFDDLPVIDSVKKKVELKILPRLTDGESIKTALAQYRRSLKAEFDSIIQKETATLKTISEAGGDTAQTEKELKALAEDLPVVQIVDTLVSHAILQNASDIHIEPMEGQTRRDRAFCSISN